MYGTSDGYSTETVGSRWWNGCIADNWITLSSFITLTLCVAGAVKNAVQMDAGPSERHPIPSQSLTSDHSVCFHFITILNKKIDLNQIKSIIFFCRFFFRILKLIKSSRMFNDSMDRFSYLVVFDVRFCTFIDVSLQHLFQFDNEK